MYGSNLADARLSVYTQDGTNMHHKYFQNISGDHGEIWHLAEVDVYLNHTSSRVQVYIYNKLFHIMNLKPNQILVYTCINVS